MTNIYVLQIFFGAVFKLYIKTFLSLHVAQKFYLPEFLLC